MKCIYLGLLVLMIASPATGQTDNPYYWSAARLLAEWEAGTDRSALGLSFRECPAESPRHDSIFRGLMAMEHRRGDLSRIATRWSSAQRRCPDPRINAWFHDQLQKAPDESDGLMLIFLWIPHGNQQAESLATQWILDPARTPAVRDAGIRHTVEGLRDPERRLRFFRAIYPHVPLSSWYLEGELYDLPRALGDGARFTMLDAVLTHPDAPSAEHVLRSLTHYTIHWREPHSTAWLARLRGGLQQLAEGARARAPLHVRETAERLSAQLAERGPMR